MYVTLVQITNIRTSHCISYRHYVITIVFSSFVVQGRGDEQRISEKSKSKNTQCSFRRDEILKSLNLCTLGDILSYIPLTQRQHPGRLGDINRRGISDASLAQEPGVRKFGYLCIQEILVLRKFNVGSRERARARKKHQQRRPNHESLRIFNVQIYIWSLLKA